MKVRSDQFSRLSSEALQDEFLREALARANASFQDARGDAVDSMPDWEELRQQAHEIKNRAIENLPEALEAFEKNTAHVGERFIIVRMESLPATRFCRSSVLTTAPV